jgi:hypothetical protein
MKKINLVFGLWLVLILTVAILTSSCATSKMSASQKIAHKQKSSTCQTYK